MRAPARPNRSDATDSPYAAELRRTDPHRRFAAPLEAEYLRAELTHDRVLIRTVTVCAVVLSLIHIVEQKIHESAGVLVMSQLGAIGAISLLLAVLAWGTAPERRYLPWASVLVPLRCLFAAVHMANAAALGNLMLLMTLPVMVIAPFFFLGLRWRTALLSSVITVAAFSAGAWMWHLPMPIAWRAGVYLLTALVASAIAARVLERRSRLAFLEGRLLAELAQRDALTGVMNRREFNQHLAQVWQPAAAQHHTLAILLIDLDHFKPYNDRYGHLAGDEALRRIAGALQTCLQRPDDLLARYGGEEFGVIVGDISRQQAWALAEQMRRAVMQLRIHYHSSPIAEMVTVSIGVATVEPIPERGCWEALQLADLALYEAKMNGRNCVELMDETEYRLRSAGVHHDGVGVGRARVTA